MLCGTALQGGRNELTVSESSAELGDSISSWKTRVWVLVNMTE
jgi:hypothetical protein